jgi:hypothetical protein
MKLSIKIFAALAVTTLLVLAVSAQTGDGVSARYWPGWHAAGRCEFTSTA